MTEQFKFNFGEFIHKHFTAILLFAGFMIWWTGKGNNANGYTTSDTTSHTVYVQQPPVIVQPYQPQQTGATVYPITIPSQYQPSQDQSKLLEQYTKVLSEYLAERRYEDSITLRDTAGNRVGVVNLKQLVSENILKETKPSYQLSFPHTTTTITNTIYPKIKNQVFMGVSVSSPISTPSVKDVGIGLIFKNKREDIIALSGEYHIQTKLPGIRVGYYKKLSFKSIPKL